MLNVEIQYRQHSQLLTVENLYLSVDEFRLQLKIVFPVQRLLVKLCLHIILVLELFN